MRKNVLLSPPLVSPADNSPPAHSPLLGSVYSAGFWNMGETQHDLEGNPIPQHYNGHEPWPAWWNEPHQHTPLSPVPEQLVENVEQPIDQLMIPDQPALVQEPIQPVQSAEELLADAINTFPVFLTPSPEPGMNAVATSSQGNGHNQTHIEEPQVVEPVLPELTPPAGVTRVPFGSRIYEIMKKCPAMIQFVPWDRLTANERYVIGPANHNRPHLRIFHQHPQFRKTFTCVGAFQRNSSNYGFSRRTNTEPQVGPPAIYMCHSEVDHPRDLIALSRNS